MKALYEQTEGGDGTGMVMELYHDKCQVCGKDTSEVIIDGKIRPSGQWAWLCEECHAKIGIGFGIGRGQKYVKVAQ